MTSLLDIAPAAERVVVGAITIECRGISARGVAGLLRRFPAVRDALWSGIGSGNPETAFDPQSLLQSAPEAIAAILAAGTPRAEGRSDEEREEAAADLPMDVQADILNAILKATMPEGIGPLVQKVMLMFGNVGGIELRPTVAGFGDESPALSNGKALDTQLPLQLSG